MICRCCGKESSVEIITDRFHNFDRIFLSCTNCGEEYDILFKCPEMKRIIKEKDRLQNINRIYKEIENMSPRMKELYLKHLRNTIEGYNVLLDELNEKNKNEYYEGIRD